MAAKDDIAGQLEAAQKLTAAINLMAVSMTKLESSFTSQAKIIEQLADTVEDLANTDTTKITKINLSEVKKEVEETGTTVLDFQEKLKNLGQEMADKFPISAAAAAGALSGFISGLKGTIAIGGSVLGFLGKFVSGAFSVGASILAIPFKLFGSLVRSASQAGQGISELQQALEKLRGEFGALSGPTPKTIIGLSKNMEGFAATGLSAWRVFGNMAQRIQELTKLATEMGPVFGILEGEFRANGGALLAYQKGLGLSGEQMKAFGENAIANGKPVADLLKDTTKYALEMGKAFGLDSKVISKDMGKAMQDVKHFAGATTKQIAEASVYSRKLGVELSKIVGTLDAFETFDAAAENASKLSQAFGVSVDAFKLMEAQDPASQIEILRKSFRDAGTDVSSFNRQQLKMLSQTTGLDEATAKLAFSTKNQGLSMDEIKKKGSEAQAKTLTQEQAMSKLADSIERLVLAGGAQEGGFFASFFKGFIGGIQSTKEFRDVIWSIKNALRDTQMQGVKLGKSFVEWFPGVKDVFIGIKDFFDPKKFQKLLTGVVAEFTSFFKSLTEGKASLPDLMKNLQKHFFEFFDKSSPSGQQLISGFKKIFTVISEVLTQGIKWISQQLIVAIGYVTEFIKNPQALLASISGKLSGASGFFGQLLAPIAKALAEAGVLLYPAIKQLGKVIFEQLVKVATNPEFLGMLSKAAPKIGLALFGPAMLKAMLGAAFGSIAQVGTTLLAKKFFGGSADKLKMPAEKLAEASSKMSKASPKEAGNAIDIVNEASRTEDKNKNFGVKDAISLFLKISAIAAGLLVGGVAIATAIVAMRGILGGMSLDDAKLPMILIAEIAVLTIPLAYAASALAKIPLSEIGKGLLNLGAVALSVGLVGVGMAAMLSGFDPATLSKAGSFMSTMTMVFLGMVPLLAAAAIIGAAYSFGGPILALLLAAGFATIAAAVAGMGALAIGIMETINQVKVDASFPTKVDAFLKIMNVISDMTSLIAKMMYILAPSIGDIFTFTSPIKRTEAAGQLIGTFLGGIQSLVNSVVENIKGIPANIGPQAAILANVLEAVAAIMKAASPSDEFVKAQASFFVSADEAKNIRDADISHIRAMFGSKGGGGITGLLETINPIIKNLLETSKGLDPQAVSAVGGIISATATILAALTPSPEVLKSLQSSNANLIASPDIVAADPARIAALGEAMKSNAASAGLLIGSFSGVIASISNIKIPKESIEGFKIVSDIMSTIGGVVQAAIAQSAGRKVDLTNANIKAYKDGVINIAAGPSIKQIFEDIQNYLPSLVRGFIDAAQIPVPRGIKEKIAAIKDIFGFMTIVSDFMKNIPQPAQNNMTAAIQVSDSAINGMYAVSFFLNRLIEPAFGANVGPIQMFANSVTYVSEFLASQKADVAGLVTNINSFFDGFKQVQNAFTSQFTQIPQNMEKAASAAKIPEIVAKMVDTVNSVNRILSNETLNTLNVDSGLMKFANAVGTSNGKYTIKNQGVHITVNMSVTMNAADLEKSLVMRGNSIIAQRIDTLAENANAEAAHGNTLSPSANSYNLANPPALSLK